MIAEPARLPGFCPECSEAVNVGQLVTDDGRHVACRGCPPRPVTAVIAAAS